MELKAAIVASKLSKKSEEVTIYTDSEYVIKGITEWMKGWKAEVGRQRKKS
jgi:ribonuclease HI